jgi:hypothetical protein
MVDPYTVLCIPKDATKAKVQKSFRRLARKAHPDAGGDREKFEELHRAYRVLMDDASRAHYDATGSLPADKPDVSVPAAKGILTNCFMAVMAQLMGLGKKASDEDLVKLMQEVLKNRRADVAKSKIGHEPHRQFLVDIVGRFETKDADNFFEGLIRGMLVNVQEQIAKIDAELSYIQLAGEILKGFKYRHDKKVVMAKAGDVQTFVQQLMMGSRLPGRP